MDIIQSDEQEIDNNPLRMYAHFSFRNTESTAFLCLHFYESAVRLRPMPDLTAPSYLLNYLFIIFDCNGV